MSEEDPYMWQLFMRAEDGDSGFYQTLWLSEDTIGEAVSRAYELLHARNARQVTVVDYDWTLPPEHGEEIIPGNHYESECHAWLKEPFEPGFLMPDGVVPVRCGHTYDLDELRRASTLHTLHDDSETAYALEFAVDRNELVTRFHEALNAFNAGARLDVVVHGHWNDYGTTLFMACPAEWSRPEVLEFIRRWENAIVRNGHVELAFHDPDAGEALRLTDHKTIICNTTEFSTLNAVADTLIDVPIVSEEEFRNIGAGYHHLHYSWPGTPDRADFVRSLYSLGFTLRRKRDEQYSPPPPENFATEE